VFTIFVIGMAGSGKSLLVSSLSEYLRASDQSVITLNLDPGATALPYSPEVDIRTYVNIDELMEKYKLGPNGALIMASDLAAESVEEIQGEIDEEAADFVLADTPGQIELFAFREFGPYFSKSIGGESKAVVYALDASFCTRPMNFVSNIFLAAAVYTRLRQPQVYALTKADLVSEEDLERIVGWGTDVEQLESTLEQSQGDAASLIARDLAIAVYAAGLVYEPIAVSARQSIGLPELNAALTRVLTGGEELRP
jgi:GTPase SAR1 family protein